MTRKRPIYRSNEQGTIFYKIFPNNDCIAVHTKNFFGASISKTRILSIADLKKIKKRLFLENYRQVKKLIKL